MSGASATGLYTQEQIDYVAGIKDEDLRDHLLHQRRAADNMTQDRNNFEKMLAKAQLKDKVIIDLEDLRNNKAEGSNYFGWQSNIAMAFYDAVLNYLDPKHKGGNLFDESFGDESLHEIANQAAKNFIDQLIKI